MPFFDAHLHIVDPRFPLVPNDGYVPPWFTVEDYRHRTAGLDVVGGAVVSASFQGFDQTYLVAALAALGPGFVGVAQLPIGVTDAELFALDEAGVRAVRVNLFRGGAAPLAVLDRLAHRVHDTVGWHTELYVDAADLPALEPRLAALPALSIDHLGMTNGGRDALLRLVAGGARVKATGFGRVADDLDVRATLLAIHDANPHALMAGSDLPSTRARRPFEAADLALVRDCVGEAALAANALSFYAPR